MRKSREREREREKMRKKREGWKPPKDFRYGAPKRNILHTIAMFFRTLGLNSRRTLQKYMGEKKTTFPLGHVPLRKVTLIPVPLHPTLP